AAIRIRAVRASREAVQYFFRPLAVFILRRAQFKNCSTVLIESVAGRSLTAAKNCGSVKIARCVKNQIACRDVALLGGWKAVKNRLGPRLAFLWRQLEHGAATGRTSRQHAIARSAHTRS